MININLLPEQTLLSQKEKRFVFQLTWVTAVVSIVVLGLFGMTFFMDRLATSRLSNLEQQYQELSTQFEENVPRLSLLIALKDKVVGIKRVLAVRPDLPKAVEGLRGFFVDGIEMTKVEMLADGNLNFTVSARDKTALNGFLDKLQSPQGKRYFQTLTISGMGLDAKGGAKFTVTSVFNKDFDKEVGRQ